MISHKMFNKFVAIIDRYYICDYVDDNRVGGEYFAIDHEAHTHVYVSRWSKGYIYFKYANNDSSFTKIVKTYREYNELIKLIKSFI